MKALRILIFESLIVVATIYALGAMINRQYSREAHTVMFVALASTFILPNDAYKAK